MKKSNYFLFIFCIVALVFAVGCDSFSNHDRQQAQKSISVDTTFASRTDSLEWVLATGIDTEKMSALFNLSLHYSPFNQALSSKYAKDLLLLARQAKERKAEGRAYHCLASGFFFQEQHDSAIFYRYKALAIFEEIKDEAAVVMTKLNIAKSLSMSFKLDESLKIMQECLDYYTENNMTYEKANTIQSIGEMHYDIMPDLAIDYYEQALKIYESLESEIRIERNRGICYVNIGALFHQKKEFEKTIEHGGKALEIFRKINDVRGIGSALKRRSNGYISLGRFEEAERDLNELFELAEKTDNNLTRREALMAKSELFSVREDYKQGLYHTKQAFAITDTTEKKVRNIILHKLAILSVYAGTSEETVDYINQYQNSTKELFSEEWSSKLTEMAAKYETEKKEFRISVLEEEKRLMTWLGIAGGAVLLLALAAFFFLWRLTVRKRQLAEIRIRQLEQEKQLVATQSVLDGETAERSRLARDLHDGLGSLLTGAKLRFLEMKQGAKLEYADVERFDHALGMLDQSVNEMRRVAHHLMPDALTRFGLKPAVSDFCSKLPSVEFIYYGDETRLDPKLEVMIYRCIYELVNNSLKHAAARNIIVQIMQRPDSISFAVQDNGNGFDPSAETKGAGLQNIRTRVAAYNGIINIDSKVGEGTETNVELRITN
jgi:signal transduction histidine kinase